MMYSRHFSVNRSTKPDMGVMFSQSCGGNAPVNIYLANIQSCDSFTRAGG